MAYQRSEPRDIKPKTTGRPTTYMARPAGRDNVVIGSLWMIGITFVLFFLPAINGFIGGLVGGYKVGSVKRALVAAILPALVVAVGLWILFVLAEAPIWGVLTGITVGMLILLSDLGLFLGAAVGGAAAKR